MKRYSGGRPSNFTPEGREAIKKALLGGASFDAASRSAGVQCRSLYRWFRLYPDFRAKCERWRRKGRCQTVRGHGKSRTLVIHVLHAKQLAERFDQASKASGQRKTGEQPQRVEVFHAHQWEALFGSKKKAGKGGSKDAPPVEVLEARILPREPEPPVTPPPAEVIEAVIEETHPAATLSVHPPLLLGGRSPASRPPPVDPDSHNLGSL